MSVLSGQQSYCSMHEVGGGAGSFSGASVFTHSSVHTTQSTRSRRPGAAKERLARAKGAEERRKNGWHESMEAAAASNHRVWEPKVGWVDYEDPVNTTADLSTDTSTLSDQMHLNVSAARRTKRDGRGTGTGIKQLDELERYPDVNHSLFQQDAEAKKTKHAANEVRDPRGKKKSAKKTKKTRTRIVDSVPDSLDGRNGKDNDTCFPRRTSRGSPERRRRQQNPSESPVPREQAPTRSRPRQQQQQQQRQSRTPDSPISVTPPAINRVVTDNQSTMPALHNGRSARSPVQGRRKVQSLSPLRRMQGAKSKSSPLPPTVPRPTDYEQRDNSARHSPESPMPLLSATSRMDSVSPARSTRSKGWVETMREATSPLEKRGHSWDPKFGFSNLNLDATSVADVIHNIGSSNATTAAPVTDSNRQNHPLQGNNISQQKRSPADVLGAMIAERRKNDPPGRKNPIEHEAAAEEEEWGDIDTPSNAEREGSPEPRASLETPPENPVQEKMQNGEETKYSAEEEQSTLPEQSTFPEPIEATPEGVMDSSGRTLDLDNVALFDDERSTLTGPIEATPGGVMDSSPDLGIVALNYEEEGDYLVGPSAPVVVTPNISVKKEKVVSGDFDLFPKFKNRKNQTHRISAPGPTNAAKNDFLKSPNGADLSCKPSSRRRDSGPVDVDEVDDMSTDESENSNVWESAKFENDSFLQGSISSSKRRGQENTRPRGISPPRASSFSKQLTKIPTFWPEHARRLAQTVRKNSDDNSPSEGRGQNTKSEEEEDEDEQRKKDSETYDLCGDFNGQKTTGGEYQAATTDRSGTLSTSRANTTRTYPQELVSDDRSHVSGASSATAGWKSFLQKKVQAERAVAARQQQSVLRDDPKDRDGKDVKIKKNVSFASEVTDSLLAESSIFDFSTNDSQSPVGDRNDFTNVTNSQPSNRGAHSSKRGPHSFESKASSYSLNHRQGASYDSTDSHSLNHISPPDRNLLFRKNRSFGTDVSPISERNEETESIAGQNTDPGQHSFLKRLAECGPILPPQHRQDREKAEGVEDGKEEGLAHNWYMHGSKAAEKVEEMMDILRSRRCNIRERSDKSKIQDASVSFRDKLSSRLQVSTSSKPNSIGEDDNDPDTKASEDLAKARVEAMLDTLYYSNEE